MLVSESLSLKDAVDDVRVARDGGGLRVCSAFSAPARMGPRSRPVGDPKRAIVATRLEKKRGDWRTSLVVQERSGRNLQYLVRRTAGRHMPTVIGRQTLYHPCARIWKPLRDGRRGRIRGREDGEL